MRKHYLILCLIAIVGINKVIAQDKSNSASTNKSTNTKTTTKSTTTKGAVTSKPKQVTDSVLLFIQKQRAIHMSLKASKITSWDKLVKSEDSLLNAITQYGYRHIDKLDYEDGTLIEYLGYVIDADDVKYGGRRPALFSQSPNLPMLGAKQDSLMSLLNRQLFINNGIPNASENNAESSIKSNNMLLDSAKKMLAAKEKTAYIDTAKNTILRAIITINKFDSSSYFSIENGGMQKSANKPNSKNAVIDYSKLSTSIHSQLAKDPTKKYLDSMKACNNVLIDSLWLILRTKGDTAKKITCQGILKIAELDSNEINALENAINPGHKAPVIDSIAAQKFQILAAVYSNINSVPDNDPPGLTQYYIYMSVPLNKRDGFKAKDSLKHLIWFRNLYFQPTYNAASSNNLLPIFVDTAGTNKKKNAYANKLDILQYAYIKAPLNINILTYIVHNGSKDYFHAYLDIMYGLLFTKDTINKQSSDLISSTMQGIHISAKTEQDFSKTWTLEAGLQIFTINPMTSSFSSLLNPQYRHLQDTAQQQNSSSKPLLVGNSVFGNLDFLVNYNITLGKVASVVYLHFDYYTNLLRFNPYLYNNTYFQVQLGTSLDIGSLFSKSSPSTTSK